MCIRDRGKFIPCPKLRFRKGDREIHIDSHDFAGGFHFRRKHGIDAGETCEGENRLLHRNVRNPAIDARQRCQLLAGHYARGNLCDRLADRLGDEGHRTAGARIDLDQIDLAVLHRELDVHPVSYTHLDVYKRQVVKRPAGRFMPVR